MPLLQDMTDAEMVECARRTSHGSMYRTMADRIEQRSADCLALIKALTRCAADLGGLQGASAVATARVLLERLEESGTMAMLKKAGR